MVSLVTPVRNRARMMLAGMRLSAADFVVAADWDTVWQELWDTL